VSPFKQSQQQDNRRPNTSNDAYFNAVEAAKKTTVSSATVKRNNITPKTGKTVGKRILLITNKSCSTKDDKRLYTTKSE